MTPDTYAPSRRQVLGGAAAAFAAIALAACGDDDPVTSPTTAGGSGTTGAAPPAGGDGAIAKLAASLEVLAVSTYGSALEAATSGKLGAVPPAVATFVQTAQGHHKMALEQWNAVLKAAGAAEVKDPPASLAATVNQQFAQIKDVGGAAKLALLLEQTAADTYLSAIPQIQDKKAITLAGALQSVDQEHAAILLYVLGQYPVPDVFQKTEKAFKG